MVAPFKERYPFIKLDYSRGEFNARALRPLIALKEGRYVTDILTGFGGSTHHYQQADALEDLRELPGFKNPLPGTGDPDGGTRAHKDGGDVLPREDARCQECVDGNERREPQRGVFRDTRPEGERTGGNV